EKPMRDDEQDEPARVRPQRSLHQPVRDGASGDRRRTATRPATGQREALRPAAADRQSSPPPRDLAVAVTSIALRSSMRLTATVTATAPYHGAQPRTQRASGHDQ